MFEGDKTSIASFLVAARGLRYLDFHHVDTRPLPFNSRVRVADSRVGLHEVQDMKTLIQALEAMALKEWFRAEMGMDKGG